MSTNIEKFMIIQPVPSSIFHDKEMLWHTLHAVWEMSLADDRGERIPGPLHIQEVKLGEIAGSELAGYLFSDPDTVAVFRISGPAAPPTDITRMYP